MFAMIGPEPKWRPLYDLLATGEIDQVFTYPELTAAAGFNVLEDRGPVYIAIKHLQRNKNRSAVCEPTLGYRIIHPTEHAGQGDMRQKRARRQVGHGLATVKAADVTMLTQEERQRNDSVMARLDTHQSMLRTLDQRVTAHDGVIGDLTSQVRLLARKVAAEAELQRNLRAHGVTVPTDG